MEASALSLAKETLTSGDHEKFPTRWQGPERRQSGWGLASRVFTTMSNDDPFQVPLKEYHPSAG